MTMRRIFFKPMRWLSVVTTLSMVILLSLAIWQYQRLQWKTTLLGNVERAVTAPPLRSLTDLRAAIANDEAVDFRRIEIEAKPIEDVPSKLVFYPQTGGIFWQGFSPITGLEAQAPIIYAATDIVEDKNRAFYKARPVKKIVGYVRFAHPLGKIEAMVKAKADIKDNRYFKFNQTGDWAEELPYDLLQTRYVFDDYYLESALGFQSADRLPVKRPKIRNNHFDYMLTWASFAIILLIIYIILHMRAGRLGWAGKRGIDDERGGQAQNKGQL